MSCLHCIHSCAFRVRSLIARIWFVTCVVVCSCVCFLRFCDGWFSPSPSLSSTLELLIASCRGGLLELHAIPTSPLPVCWNINTGSGVISSSTGCTELPSSSLWSTAFHGFYGDRPPKLWGRLRDGLARDILCHYRLPTEEGGLQVSWSPRVRVR